MPAVKNPFENPGLDAAGAAGWFAEEPGRVNTVWFPEKLSEPLIARASASTSTYERPFTCISGTCSEWPLITRVRLWLASCASAIPDTARDNPASSQPIDCFALIALLLQFRAYVPLGVLEKKRSTRRTDRIFLLSTLRRSACLPGRRVYLSDGPNRSGRSNRRNELAVKTAMQAESQSGACVTEVITGRDARGLCGGEYLKLESVPHKGCTSRGSRKSRRRPKPRRQTGWRSPWCWAGRRGRN